MNKGKDSSSCGSSNNIDIYIYRKEKNLFNYCCYYYYFYNGIVKNINITEERGKICISFVLER